MIWLFVIGLVIVVGICYIFIATPWDIERAIEKEHEEEESKRSILLRNVEVSVIRRLGVSDEDFTEMVNVALRDRYKKDRMITWLEMTEEEAIKILHNYGWMKGID